MGSGIGDFNFGSPFEDIDRQRNEISRRFNEELQRELSRDRLLIEAPIYQEICSLIHDPVRRQLTNPDPMRVAKFKNLIGAGHELGGKNGRVNIPWHHGAIEFIEHIVGRSECSAVTLEERFPEIKRGIVKVRDFKYCKNDFMRIVTLQFGLSLVNDGFVICVNSIGDSKILVPEGIFSNYVKNIELKSFEFEQLGFSMSNLSFVFVEDIEEIKELTKPGPRTVTKDDLEAKAISFLSAFIADNNQKRISSTDAQNWMMKNFRVAGKAISGKGFDNRIWPNVPKPDSYKRRRIPDAIKLFGSDLDNFYRESDRFHVDQN